MILFIYSKGDSWTNVIIFVYSSYIHHGIFALGTNCEEFAGGKTFAKVRVINCVEKFIFWAIR